MSAGGHQQTSWEIQALGADGCQRAPPGKNNPPGHPEETVRPQQRTQGLQQETAPRDHGHPGATQRRERHRGSWSLCWGNEQCWLVGPGQPSCGSDGPRRGRGMCPREAAQRGLTETWHRVATHRQHLLGKEGQTSPLTKPKVLGGEVSGVHRQMLTLFI